MSDRAERVELEALQHERATLERELDGPSRPFIEACAAHMARIDQLPVLLDEARREEKHLLLRETELDQRRLEENDAWDRHVGALPLVAFLATFPLVGLRLMQLLEATPLLALPVMGFDGFLLGLLIGPRALRFRPKLGWPVPRVVSKVALAIGVPVGLLSAVTSSTSWSPLTTFRAVATLLTLGALQLAFLLCRAKARAADPAPAWRTVMHWLTTLGLVVLLAHLPGLLIDRAGTLALLSLSLPTMALLRTAAPRATAWAHAPLLMSLVASGLTFSAVLARGNPWCLVLGFVSAGWALGGLVLSGELEDPTARADGRLINALALLGAVVAVLSSLG